MYYFIFGPNNSGTTAMSQYLAARTGAYLPPFGNFEGQWVPEVADMLQDRAWQAGKVTDWSRVRPVWDGYMRADGKTAFVEASPANMMRVGEILDFFGSDARPVFLIADPYMQIASCLKNYTTGPLSVEAIRDFTARWVMKARQQRRNTQGHPAIPLVHYEAFGADPTVLDRALGLRRWPWQRAPRLPGKSNRRAGPLQKRERRIRDLSVRNIAFLHPAEALGITGLLRPERDVLAHFGYGLIEDDAAFAARLATAPDLAEAGRETRAKWEHVD